jgi:DNA-binding NarL/FixJ family response regulator
MPVRVAFPPPQDVRPGRVRVRGAPRRRERVPAAGPPPEELVAAVRLIASGEALLAPSVTRRLIEEFARRAPAVKPTELDELTERERQVLVLMAKGLSNAEIARALFVAETMITTHVGRVLHKLRLRDRAQAVVLAYESGLVHPSD